MNCCGKGRASRYCPECGKQLYAPGDLYDLLRHLDHRARWCHIKADRISKDSADADAPTARRKAGRERLAQKWQGWADALRRLLGEK